MRKQCFLTFFETLCTKFAENAKKRRFLRYLRDVPQKVWGNSVFSRYLRHLNLLKVSQKLRKTAFFKLSARCSPKSVWKQCFFHVFRDTLYKVRKKCWKTVFFFELFARRSPKSVKKQCSFTFFETHCTKFAKYAEKERFLSFLRDIQQKLWENSVFFKFSRHFEQSSQKMRRTAFLELFARRSPKSVRKQSFFMFFETLCTKFAKNAEKHRF